MNDREKAEGPPQAGEAEGPPAQQAAAAAADPDRLLPDEDPATTKPDEARHWISSYSQLLGFKDELLASAHQQLAELTERDARREAVGTDLVLLQAENDRLRRRLDFWKERHLALQS